MSPSLGLADMGRRMSGVGDHMHSDDFHPIAGYPVPPHGRLGGAEASELARLVLSLSRTGQFLCSIASIRDRANRGVGKAICLVTGFDAVQRTCEILPRPKPDEALPDSSRLRALVIAGNRRLDTIVLEVAQTQSQPSHTVTPAVPEGAKAGAWVYDFEFQSSWKMQPRDWCLQLRYRFPQSDLLTLTLSLP
jgi:hypothetical protein